MSHVHTHIHIRNHHILYSSLTKIGSRPVFHSDYGLTQSRRLPLITKNRKKKRNLVASDLTPTLFPVFLSCLLRPAPVFLLFFIFFSAQSAGKGEKETMNRIFRWNQRQGPLHLLVVSTQLTSAQAHGLGVTRSSKIEESKDCCNLCTLVVATLLRCGILTLFFFFFFFFFRLFSFLGY